MSGMDLFGDEERKEVMDVLETTCMFRYNHEHLRKGQWKAKSLEQEVCQFTKARYAHAVSSGSTAVSTMLATAGIGYGDEVIVPPFTYIAPIEAVLLNGALPVFADIDETLCLSADGIEKALTPKTKAVLLVHMCGGAAHMDALLQVCKKHNLILIEDAGQALGAFYKGTSVGLFGEVGAFSFDFFKITTMGEGGVIITSDNSHYDTIQQFSDHGHTHVGLNRGMEQHSIFGSNFRISELHAALGLAQMRKIKTIIENNKKAKTYLKEVLAEIEGISFRTMQDPQGDSATFLNFFLNDEATAQRVMLQFLKDEVAGMNYWYTNMYHFVNQWDHIKNLKSPMRLAIHELGAPQDYNNIPIPKAQNIIGRLISLGIKSNWTTLDLEIFGEKLKTSLYKVLG